MVKVRVPATSANMGSGFDSLGIALKLYNEYEFAEIPDGVVFEGIEDEFANEDNIILIAMKRTFERYSYNYTGVLIKVLKQDIPISRGLGSSSSCIVAGIVGAMKLMNVAIDKNIVFEIAVEIEGHPDNVCPAIFGGLVTSILNDNIPIYNEINIKPGVKFVALVPNFKLSTSEARAILPKEVDLKDATFNIGRATLLVSAFSNGRYELLRYACEDKLHQDYRSTLIEGFNELYKESMNLGALACYLSGAGPTLMVILSDDNKKYTKQIIEFILKLSCEYSILELDIDYEGVVLV